MIFHRQTELNVPHSSLKLSRFDIAKPVIAKKKRETFFADFRSSTIQCRTQNSFHKRFLVFSSNTQLRTWHMRYQRHKKGPALSSTNMPSKLLRQRRQEDKDLFQKHICISKYYFIGNVHIAYPQNPEVIFPDIFESFLIKQFLSWPKIWTQTKFEPILSDRFHLRAF